jgi:hypothetical protein
MPAPGLSGSETRGERWCSTAPCPLAQHRGSKPWPPPGPLGSSASTAASPGTWRAARWARAGMPWVRGPARAMPARPGGPAPHDRIAAPTRAVVRRGGLRPQASGAPAARRATRERLRRRRQRMRHRAALWAHRQQTNRPAHPPARGQQRADHAPRVGVAARCPAPAGPPRRAVERARRGHDAARLRAMAPARGRPATHPSAHPRYRRRTVPGLGARLRWGLLAALQAIPRCPRGPAVASYGRWVTWAKASAGKRSGPAGPQRAHASRPWAFCEAALWFRRRPAAGQKELARLEHTPGPGTAVTVVAPPWARAVADLLTRRPAFDRPTCLPGQRRGAEEPAGSLDAEGLSRRSVLGPDAGPASRRPRRTEAIAPAPCAVMGPPLRRGARAREPCRGDVGCPAPEPGTPWPTVAVAPARGRGRSAGTAMCLGRRGHAERSRPSPWPWRENRPPCVVP